MKLFGINKTFWKIFKKYLPSNDAIWHEIPGYPDFRYAYHYIEDGMYVIRDADTNGLFFQKASSPHVALLQILEG